MTRPAKSSFRSVEAWAGFALGFVGTLLLPIVSGWLIRPDTSRAKALADMSAIATALEVFRLDHGRMPSAQEGLAPLAGELLDRVPVDPWGNAYVWRPDASGASGDVLTYGADSREGGSGSASDISFGVAERRRAVDDEISQLAEWNRRRGAASFAAGLLITPLIGLIVSLSRPAGAGILAGAAACCGVKSLAWAIGLISAGRAPVAGLSGAIGLASLAGAATTLAQVRYARVFTFTVTAIVAGLSVWLTLNPS